MASFYSSLYFFHIYLFPSTFMYLSTSPLSFFIFPEVSTFFFPSWRPVDPRCAMCCSSTVHVHCTMRARQGFQQSYCPVTYYSYVYCSYSDRYFWIFCNGIPVVSALLLSRAGRRDNFRRPCDNTRGVLSLLSDRMGVMRVFALLRRWLSRKSWLKKFPDVVALAPKIVATPSSASCTL